MRPPPPVPIGLTLNRLGSLNAPEAGAWRASRMPSNALPPRRRKAPARARLPSRRQRAQEGPWQGASAAHVSNASPWQPARQQRLLCHRQRGAYCVRSPVVRARSAGPVRHGRHGVLCRAGGVPQRDARAAARRAEPAAARPRHPAGASLLRHRRVPAPRSGRPARRDSLRAPRTVHPRPTRRPSRRHRLGPRRCR